MFDGQEAEVQSQAARVKAYGQAGEEGQEVIYSTETLPYSLKVKLEADAAALATADNERKAKIRALIAAQRMKGQK